LRWPPFQRRGALGDLAVNPGGNLLASAGSDSVITRICASLYTRCPPG
jgi:hypothetical protein